ncbi:MAG: hypothetical protein ACI8W8_000710 [Rhodothermales bacterium]|jgi:hypothetical protein
MARGKKKKLAPSKGSKLPLGEMESAVWLACKNPRQVLWYLLGSIPFWTMLVLFWGEMRFNNAAADSCALWALALSVTFVWMKACHVLYTSQLRRALDDDVASWSLPSVLAMLCRQTLLHATGIIIYPIAVILALPFGWCYAFYQNLSVLDEPNISLRELTRASWDQAMLQPKENHWAIWLASPAMIWAVAVLVGAMGIASTMVESSVLEGLGIMFITLGILIVVMAPVPLLVAVNVAALLMAVPYLLRIFLGIETMMSTAPVRVLTSPTFLLVVTAITYVLLDPIMKAYYVIRCFLGRSRVTGADLALRWRAIVVAIVLLSANSAIADEPIAVGNDQQLNAALDDVLSEREFAWRMPRDPLAIDDEFAGEVLGPFEQILEAVRNIGKTLEEWLAHLRPPESDAQTTPGVSWQTVTTNILLIVVTLLVAVLVILLVRHWRAAREEPTIEAEVAEDVPVPDLEDENIDVGALPDSAWVSMARDLAAKGDHRLAIRALFLAVIARLGDRNLLLVARFKSNADYERELARRAHALPQVMDGFRYSRGQFERVWYGTDQANDRSYEEFQAHAVEILKDA